VRENYRSKGRNYVAEARLTVTRVDGSGIRATCKGSGAVYELGFENGRWYCSCPAFSTCAHIHALQLVTVREANS
jgi:hypothetical protein